MDILDAIDTAVGCHQCGGPMGLSPSDVFCRERCQKAWAAKRVGAELEQPSRLERNLQHCQPPPPFWPPSRVARAQTGPSLVDANAPTYTHLRARSFSDLEAEMATWRPITHVLGVCVERSFMSLTERIVVRTPEGDRVLPQAVVDELRMNGTGEAVDYALATRLEMAIPYFNAAAQRVQAFIDAMRTAKPRRVR